VRPNYDEACARLHAAANCECNDCGSVASEEVAPPRCYGPRLTLFQTSEASRAQLATRFRDGVVRCRRRVQVVNKPLRFSIALLHYGTSEQTTRW